jgi:ABC-type nitrate/sulfonate/bicarbonate transport system substrate-binding protein
MTRIKHLAVMIATCVLAITATASGVSAQQKIRFAFIKSTTLIPLFFAQEKGYLKAEGLDVEMISVPGGPAVIAAMAGGSADIGYAAITPVAIARDQGQPYKFFVGLEQEHHPKLLWGSIIASEKSGVKTMADVKGKKVMVAAPGGLCELATREWLASAGLKWTDIQPLHNPPPQMQAALEVGNADVACIFEPFFTAAMASKANPVVLAQGYLARHPDAYTVDGLFASDKWIAENGKAIDGIKRATLKAWAELAKDPALVKKILADEFRFPQSLVDKLRLDYVAQIGIEAKMVQPIVDALVKHGMVKPAFKTSDIVHAAQ